MRSVASAPRGEPRGLRRRSGASIWTTSLLLLGSRNAPGRLRFLLVSSLGASPNSPFLYPRTKGESEAAISAIGFTTVVVVRPSFLVGARPQERPSEAVALRVGRLIQPFLIDALRKYAPAGATAVARTLVRAAATATVGVTVIESDSIR
jgi:uncharacterized protein YbjT (DUF2867 family)